MSVGSQGALTGFERAVLDLWDAGLGSRAIATRLGRRERTVCKVINTYAGGETGQHARAIAAGTDALLAALRAHHPELFHVEAA